jgi:hypothetical protein
VIRGSLHSVAPTATDVMAPHHGLSLWAGVVLIAGAALVAVPMLMSRGGPDGAQGTTEPLAAPAAAQPAEPAGESSTALHEQFIQLDEVFVTVDTEELGASGNLLED